jgi:CheY-like chemotaxis protein
MVAAHAAASTAKIGAMSAPGRGPDSAILIADDDEDDRLMLRDALREAQLQTDLHFVTDGVELLEYLSRRGRYGAGSGEDAPRPGLILLDLNMPRMDGREALAAIKADPALRSIPVVVLTTSKDAQDVASSYDLGVNAFITKPVTYLGLVEVMKVVARFWLEIVDLPPEAPR